MRILIVEDDDLTREVLTADLSSRGHSVQAVETFAGGQAALSDGQFDAVIVDLVLPDGDGLQLAAEATVSGCKPIIMTASPDALHRVQQRNLPCLRKPVRGEDVAAALEARAPKL